MITEFPGKRILRRMGYLSDQKGILNRYLTEGDQWDEHLDRTISFINRAISGTNPGRVVVLGSGWMLDLALDELYLKCRNISLVDVNHPPQVLHKAGKYPGVNAVYADVTGGLIKDTFDMVTRCRKTGKNFDPDNLDVPSPSLSEEAFIISLNILDQLDTLIVEYINRWFDPPGDALDRLRKKIQAAHLEMIRRHRGCILADEMEILLDKNGRKVKGKKLLHVTLPKGNLEDEWDWKFDNHFHYHEDYKTWFRVKAVSF